MGCISVMGDKVSPLQGKINFECNVYDSVINFKEP
jgi:hypothetical protein